MSANVLVIARSDGTFDFVADERVVAYLRDDRPECGMIPVRAETMINPHEFSREIAGVEVARFSAEEVASWVLVNQTAKQAMVDAALHAAGEAKLVNNINRDHAMIEVVFDKALGQWHCYLEFEEDV